MSDTLTNALVVALVVLPAWFSIQLAQDILVAVFENHALLLSFPFP